MSSGLSVLSFLGDLLALSFVALLAWIAWAYAVDRRQAKHTIRRNYPVLGRFRYFLEHLGVFFRQYFFAQDREELPFNRAQRGWVYRAAKNKSLNEAFGSTYDLQRPGTPIFLNAFLPIGADVEEPPQEIVFGPHCPNPYTTRSIFNISAMSFGALSAPAVESLSKGAALAGCWLNTGEGAISPHHLKGNCDLVFQIGTAKYGVRDEQGQLSNDKLREIAQKPQVVMFEIKLSQGAKPGKGGILPASKVTAEIASTRGIPEGQASLSPNSHVEIQSVDDLLALINRIRRVTEKPVGIKFVLGDTQWIEDLFSTIRQQGEACAPDFITLDSGDGGTGAAPQPLIDHTGLPIRESLPIVINRLNRHGLRERIRVIASGKLLTPSAVAFALAAGADAINNARGFMFSLGCVQALQCHKNTCPAGVTTHDPHLQRGLVPSDKAQRVYHYHQKMVESVTMIAHSCGVTEPRQLQPRHVRVVENSGQSRLMSEWFSD